MRLLRHLTFSNVLAALALFIALGGAAYAGTQINGKSIVNGSIGGGKLRNGTITASKIKKGTITGTQIREGSIDASQIDLSTLGTVPSAQNATSAQTAQIATTAQTAKHADEASTAKLAKEAETATSAANATDAAHATEADRATITGEAEKLDGKTAGELTVACREGTERYGGMCWDESVRPARFWLAAVKECGEDEGRLPTISELIAYVLQPGIQAPGQTWSGDLAETAGSSEDVFTSDELGRGATDGAGSKLGYRCVFLPTN